MIFEQHPDGTIFLRKDDGSFYMDNLPNFEIDSGFAVPPLPGDWLGRRYVQGVKLHLLKLGTADPDPSGQDWPEMDIVLADIDTILINQANRIAPIPPIPPTLSEFKINAGFVVKEVAEKILTDIDKDVTKITLRTTLAPFKTQLTNASTVTEVETIQVAAIDALKAL